MLHNKKNTTSNFLIYSIFTIILFRFLLIIVLPLQDKTETRYAEIARLMVETKEWVVLQIDYGLPFWAKPPLSTWLSAISVGALGLSELALRLPSFLLGIGIILLLLKILKKEKVSSYLPIFVLLTMPEFLLHMGVVSTDSALAFSVVIIMLSFWKAMKSEKRSYWGYLFFIGIGLGLISKGPIVLVLTAPPIFIWCLMDTKRFKEVFLKLPWILGILLMTLITVPWYILMEKRSPGFLEYFIIGEHLGRFTESEWKNDLYGGPKSQFRGMVWVFLFVFAFPWVQFVFISLWKKRKQVFKNKWISYLVFWLLWTPIFFTFSKNILHTYLLPIMVPIALLVTYWWKDFERKKMVLRLSAIFPILIICSFFGLYLTGTLDNYVKSDKSLIENQMIRAGEKNIPVYYWFHKTYSGQFYTHGQAGLVKKPKDIDSVMKLHDTCLFVIHNKNIEQMPNYFKGRVVFKESNRNKSIYLYNRKP